VNRRHFLTATGAPALQTGSRAFSLAWPGQVNRLPNRTSPSALLRFQWNWCLGRCLKAAQIAYGLKEPFHLLATL
jgi:hypothetical protein